MALFHHRSGSDGEFVTTLHIRQGAHAAGLDWTLRDRWAREILIFRSTEGVVRDDVDPTTDHRQRVVYQGRGLDARVDDNLGDNVAYYYPDDIHYYYSVFAMGDDGDWYLQLTATAVPRSLNFWRRPGGHSDDQRLERPEFKRDRRRKVQARA